MSTIIRGQGLTAYKTPDSALSNTSKNSVQNKVVNENITDLDGRIGNISALKTEDKSSLVKAINEVAENAGSVTLDEYAPVIEKTDTGSFCKVIFVAAAADRPIKELEFELEPKQSGTGTPSSENVRELSGWTNLSILLIAPNYNSLAINEATIGSDDLNRSGTGTPSPENPMPIIPVLTIERDNESILSVYSAALVFDETDADHNLVNCIDEYANCVQIKDLEWEMPSESIFSCTISDAETGIINYAQLEGVSIYQTSKGYNSESNLIASIPNYKLGTVSNSNKRYIKDTRYTSVEDFINGVGDELLYYNTYTNSALYSLSNRELMRVLTIVNENANPIYKIDFKNYIREIDWEQTAGTIYGGKVAIDKEGNVTVTKEWNIIASYNNETLPGEWMSSKDVYVEGTTPTVGAQVAYKLAAPSATYHFNIEPMFTYGRGSMLFVDNDNERNSHKITYQQDTATYILSLGHVSTTDYAKAWSAGVIKLGMSNNGLKITSGQTYAYQDGVLQINKATDAQVKAGTDTYAPIVPSNQKNSVFYGLAAAAGDTTQKSSNNAVGNYTDTAKTKIKTMLGVDGGRVEVLTPTDTTLTLQPVPTTYKWGEVASLTLTVTADSEYHFMFTCPSGAATVLNTPGITGTMGDDLAAGGTYEVDIWAGIRNIREIEVTAV